MNAPALCFLLPSVDFAFSSSLLTFVQSCAHALGIASLGEFTGGGSAGQIQMYLLDTLIL